MGDPEKDFSSSIGSRIDNPYFLRFLLYFLITIIVVGVIVGLIFILQQSEDKKDTIKLLLKTNETLAKLNQTLLEINLTKQEIHEDQARRNQSRAQMQFQQEQDANQTQNILNQTNMTINQHNTDMKRWAGEADEILLSAIQLLANITKNQEIIQNNILNDTTDTNVQISKYGPENNALGRAIADKLGINSSQLLQEEIYSNTTLKRMLLP